MHYRDLYFFSFGWGGEGTGILSPVVLCTIVEAGVYLSGRGLKSLTHLVNDGL